MKKNLLIVFSSLIVITLVIVGVFYLLSLQKVSFSLENTDAITVYSAGNKNVGTLSTDGHLMLKKGEYYIIPEGENITKDKINFSVEDEAVTIVVNPPFTDEYLNETLEKETSSIEAALNTKYPTLYSNYTLTNGSLYGKGEWFGSLLAPKVSDPRQQKDSYRVVLHKKDGEWQVVRRPEYILTSSRYSDVPVAILKDINSKV